MFNGTSMASPHVAGAAALLVGQGITHPDAVKAQLKANTEQAIARGLFGVPSYGVDDKLFWGFDALAMLRAYLEGDPWFSQGEWDAAARRPAAQRRAAS